MPTEVPRLSAADMEILAFARETLWNTRPGRRSREGLRETAILERFGMTAVAFDMAVNELLVNPAAEAYDPEFVRRRRRLRERRRATWAHPTDTTVL